MSDPAVCKACGHERVVHQVSVYAALDDCRACACPRYIPPWAGPQTPCRTCGHLYAVHVPEACGECQAGACSHFVPPRQDPDGQRKCANCPHSKFIHHQDACKARVGGDRKACSCGGFAYRQGDAPEAAPFDADDEQFFQGLRGETR